MAKRSLLSRCPSYFNINLNVSKVNKKVHLLVHEQYIDSIMHGATIKET